MANKPIHLRMKAKNPCGRQAMWEAIRANKDGFTFRAIVDSFSELNAATFRTYLRGLVKAGFVEMSDKERYQPATFKLIKDVGINAPKVNRYGQFVKQGQGNEQMWRAMKMLKQFKPSDLQVAAGTEECSISFETARSYVSALYKAGYLKRLDDGTYCFIASRYTGPRAPMIQRLKTVFDPNLQKIVWQQEASDD